MRLRMIAALVSLHRCWFGMVALALLLAGAMQSVDMHSVATGISAALDAVLPTFRALVVRDILLEPWFYAVWTIAMLLRWFKPAMPQHSLLSHHHRQDVIWVLLMRVFDAVALPIYIVVLRAVYDRWLAFLTLDEVAQWSWAGSFTATLLFTDFSAWFTHLVRHKLTFVWRLHALHHAQRELNFFSYNRTHPLDQFWRQTVICIPAFMIEQSITSILAISAFRHWYNAFSHSNIRTNFGLLRYVLVTPQSHRIHHSREPQHRDCNFGSLFSIWDHVFGTQYRNYNEYPDTGIGDPAFPDDARDWRSIPGSLWRQFAYPFRPQSS